MTLDALKKAGVPVLAYGNFLTIVVNFVLLAFIIFLMVKQINRLRRQADPADAPPAAPPEDVVLLREIRDSLRRPRLAAAQLPGHADRLDQAGGVGPAAAGDVERRAVVGAGAHQRQAQRDVHALFDAEVLHRDQPLVVVHRDHHVELARLAAGARGPA